MDETTFLKYILKGESCWLWTRAKTPAGYGVFSRNNKLHYAHHQSWKLWKNQELPKLVRHTCKNKHCVNPDHLEAPADPLRPHLENQSIDRERDGTDNKGERHGRHVLTEQDVLEMRQLRREGWSLKSLMERYPVQAHSALLMALNGSTWSHLPNPITETEAKELRHHKPGKLTEEQKQEIRQKRAMGVTFVRLGQDYDVSATTIQNICKEQ